MAIIGTDVSLDVCKDEGYMMIEYDGRRKFNRDRPVRVFCYYPSYLPRYYDDMLRTDEEYSFNDLEEMYKKHRKSLNESCETDKHINFDDPDYYDLLNLASDLAFVVTL